MSVLFSLRLESVCRNSRGLGSPRDCLCLRKEQSHSGVRHVTMAGGEESCARCCRTKVLTEVNAVKVLSFQSSWANHMQKRSE